MIYKIEALKRTFVNANTEEEAMEKYENEDFVAQDEEVRNITTSSITEALT